MADDGGSVLDQDTPLIGADALVVRGQGETLILTNDEIEIQSYAYWCWASVGSFLARFYSPGSGWNQCNLATSVLIAASVIPTGVVCCTAGTDATCNQIIGLDVPLRYLGILRSILPLNGGSVPIETIAPDLRARRMLVLRILYPGIGHCVSVSGFSILGARSWVWINDPGTGSNGWHVYPDILSSYIISVPTPSGPVQYKGQATHIFFA